MVVYPSGPLIGQVKCWHIAFTYPIPSGLPTFIGSRGFICLQFLQTEAWNTFPMKLLARVSNSMTPISCLFLEWKQCEHPKILLQLPKKWIHLISKKSDIWCKWAWQSICNIIWRVMMSWHTPVCNSGCVLKCLYKQWMCLGAVCTATVTVSCFPVLVWWVERRSAWTLTLAGWRSLLASSSRGSHRKDESID